jgi:hypothetical protein
VNWRAEIDRIAADHAAATSAFWRRIERVEAQAAAYARDRARLPVAAPDGAEPRPTPPRRSTPGMVTPTDSPEDEQFPMPKSWLV